MVNRLQFRVEKVYSPVLVNMKPPMEHMEQGHCPMV